MMWDMQNIQDLIHHRKLQIVNFIDTDYEMVEDRQITQSIEQANCVISQLDFTIDNQYHMPILDIDYEAHLVPSTTPGHYHLYLNRYVTWRKYKRLLRALKNAGLIEEPFYRLSIQRGHTSARLPWVKKEEKVF